MGRAEPDPGDDDVRVAVRQLPLLTSRRHIDLVRVCSAASSPRDGGPASGRA
ncbi:hypothetical protein [Streptomyces sp. Tu 3180]|uniref:hypothetical protein n=1 Tax=Streptomyces sp. Tu 3180 TaxID=2682611 RepID=UPI00140B87A1|nr:hypothetical protein [Streptomyces sp. Tu 3180]KAF3468587.1 hypothetical protein GL259_32780 [Streptomyces sp. Tu 3180]